MLLFCPVLLLGIGNVPEHANWDARTVMGWSGPNTGDGTPGLESMDMVQEWEVELSKKRVTKHVRSSFLSKLLGKF